MSNHDDEEGMRGARGLPVVPALHDVEGSAARSSRDETDLEAPKGGAPEQLGFSLRFEGGKALLALDHVTFAPGLEVKRALFEVPDVAFPLDVTGGATRFQDRRLTLRGVELALAHDTLFVPDRLRAAGLTLLRERTRPGGLELLLSVVGAGGDVPVRARGLFVAAGDAGVAIVLHEIIPFGAAPRPRLELGQLLLDALALPGGQAARAMVRRAHPFRAVFSRLLPAFGWKVPAMGEVRVHEVLLTKGQIILRAWAGEIPDGWKPPRRQRPGPLEEAVALALFADDLSDAKDDSARIAVVDRLLDEGAAPPTVVPFAAELLRRDSRRRAEGDDLVEKALEQRGEHLGLLSAHVDAGSIDAAERGRRLLALGRAADAQDEPWVSARAFLVAAELAETHGDKQAARDAAEAAWSADPTHGPTGALFVRLAVEAGELEAALRTGRAALERLERPEEAEALAVTLAPIAQALEGAEAARALLRRALRREDRLDALMALVRLEITDGKLERAAETLARLLALESDEPTLRADVHLLAAELADARGDLESARLHLGRARELRPDDAGLAVRQAALHQRLGDLGRAIDALQPLADEEPAPPDLLLKLAELRVARAQEGDADKALAMLARAEAGERSPAVSRIEAEAKALLGDVAPLAALLEVEARESESDEPAARVRALELYARAGQLEDAARVCVEALRAGAVEGLAGVLVAQADDTLAQAASDAARAAGDLEAAAVHALAALLKRNGRPMAGHALLLCLDDVDALRERVELAAAAGDTSLERRERTALAGLLEEAAEPEELHAVLCRLAALERAPGGGGPAAEAAVWARAAALGDVDIFAWLESSLASGSSERLAEVLRRRDADLGRVPTSALREVATGAWLDDAPEVRVRLLEAVAERDGLEDDAALYLAAAREHLPPRVAAAAFARFANRHERAPWLLTAAELEDEAGDAHAALHRLLGSLDTPLAAHLPILDALLERALAASHADGIARAASVLYAHGDAPVPRKIAALTQASEALADLDVDAWRLITAAWLDLEPAADAPLVSFLEDALAQGERAKALARLRARLAAPEAVPEAVLALLEQAAEDAAARGDADDEVDARELRARALGRLDDGGGESAVRELLRLAQLYLERGDGNDAVRALSRRVSLGGDDEEVAACLRQIADIEQQRGADEAAADALTAALQRTPDDAITSQRLILLLERMSAWERLAGERRRRAGLLEPGPERTAALVKLGDLLAEELQRAAEAERVWLNAIRSTWSEAPLSRLLKRAQESNSHRLFIRAHLAAARALRGEAGASAHAMEAGADLAALLDRPTLAIAAYRYAADQAADPLPALRALVELHRAVGDAPAGLAVVDRMGELTSGSARALTLEMRADLLEALARDLPGAEAARREALREDPTFRASALALERMLRDQGRIADAIDVRRQLADAAEAPAHRAQTYASLAESARDELRDLTLAAELAREALLEQPRLINVRLLRIACLEGAGRPREAAEELGWLLDNADLPAQERVTLCRRKAAIERDQLADLQAARSTLRAEHARSPTLDVIADEVATVEEELGEPAAAAQALVSCLSEHPDGSDVLGNRREVLERVARLLDDAGDAEAALDRLLEAAELGRLSRQAELGRARLAETLERPEIAATALKQLLSGEHGDAEETVALLGRLAVAAESAGDPPAALAAWRERAERLPADVESLLAVERLGGVVEDASATRAACEHLVRLEVGGDEAMRVRFLWLAADSRARENDAAGAYRWLERAAAVRVDAALLGQMLECAEEAGDREAVLEVLARLEAGGEGLPASALLRRAELHLDVSEDIESALASAREALDREPVQEDRAAAVLSRVGELRPQAVLEALLDAPDGSLAARVLRRCLGALARYTAAELARLADRFPADEELVCAAAEAEAEVGQGVSATDRLLTLAAALEAAHPGAAAAHRERAAEVLLASEIDSGALLGRFSALKPALAQDRERRLEALHLLRDAEAFDLVAELLESALAHGSVEERRPLRMELVAVLRDGLEDPARAAVWLEEQVSEDPDDREAWGDLIECLEELGENARLVTALARRIERSTGLERRELIRRRTELLLRLGRAEEAVTDLLAAREEEPHDPTLKDLERRARESLGSEALAAFYSAELRRPGSEPMLEDAFALLELPPFEVSAEDRVVALSALARAGSGAARDAAERALTARLPAARRALEATGAALALDGSVLAGFLAGLAAFAHHLGVEGALSLSDSLADAGVAGVGRAFQLSAVARRERSAGPAAAWAALEQLGPDDVPTAERARAALTLALRLGQARLASAALEHAELDFVTTETFKVMLEGGAGVARAELEVRAAAGVARAGQGAGGLLAAVRVGDADVVRARLRGPPHPSLAEAAARGRLLRLTGERLPLRLLMSRHLLEGGSEELEAIAAAGRAAGDLPLAAEALDAVIAADGATPERAVARADIALELDESGAARHCSLAADLSSEPLAKLHFRRKAVELLVRAGNGAAEVEAGLRALATTAVDDVSLVREALRLAEAMQLHTLVEELLAEDARLAGDERERAAAVRRRADHLNAKLRRPAAAFDVLLAAADRLPDEGFLEQAYRLAVEEGLVEHQLSVVQDPLAEAALLGLLGRVEVARDRARLLDGPAARLLEADLCSWAGDVDGEAAALVALVGTGSADPSTSVRLARTALSAGDANRALATAVTLALSSGPADALDVVIESLPAAHGEELASALDSLPSLIARQRAGDPRLDALLDAWSRAALAAGREDDVRRALRHRAERVGSDAAWIAWLREALSAEPAAEVATELERHLDRPAVIRALAASDAQALGVVLEQLVPDAAAKVGECLGALHDLEPLVGPLAAVLIACLRALGRDAEAAALVLAQPAQTLSQLRERQTLGAELALAARDAEQALAALLAIPAAALGDEERRLARRVLEIDARAGVLALVHIAEASAAPQDVELALAAALEAPSEVATAVAAWRLRTEPRDVRAWELASTRGAPAARRFFGAQLAAIGSAPWPDELGADASRVRRLRERDWALPRPAAPQHDVVWTARYGAAEDRPPAWVSLAEHARAAGEPIASARLLLRAGVPLHDAPIEVRLVADPSLREPRARADALAAAVLESTTAPERAGDLRVALEELDAGGWLGARHRAALVRLGGGAPFSGLIDGAEPGIRCVTIVEAVGRHPSLARRSTAAALLASLGARGVAGALLPALFSEAGGAAPAPRAGLDVDGLERRAQAAAEAGRPDEHMSLLRTLAALRGPVAEDEVALRVAAAGAGRWSLVAESLWREAAITEARERRGQLQLERARVIADRLQRPDVALHALREAAELLPDEEGVLALWVELARQVGSPREEADALQALERRAASPAERGTLVLRRATLLRESLASAGAALAALDGALAAIGDRGDLLEARAVCLLELGERAQAAATFSRAAAATQGPKRDALREQAAALYEALGDVERACEALERSAVEGDESARLRLEALARESDLPAVLERALALSYEASRDVEARRRLALERAALLESRLDRRAEALALLEDQAVADERDVGARLALAAWYLEDRRVLDAALAYESAARIPDLLPAAVASAAREGASLLAARGDLERAGPLAQLAIDKGAADEATLSIALAHHRAHERWEEVDELLVRSLDVASTGRERAFVWMERMLVHRDRLGDPDGAKQALHRALEAAPDHAPALAAMRALAQETDAWGPLRAALSRAAELVDDRARQVEWLREIAALDVARFSDLKAADATLIRAMELAPDDAEVLIERAHLLVRLGEMDALPSLLERAVQAGVTKLPADLELVRGDALLLEGDREGARRCFEAAAAASAAAASAPEGDGEEDTDLGSALHPDAGRDEPEEDAHARALAREIQSRAWDRLMDLARADGDDPLLARALHQARQASDDPSRQAALAREELSALLRVGDRDGAALAADALLRVDPGDSNAFEIIKADHLRRRRLDALAPKFEAWARGAEDDGAVARRLAELGTFLLDELGSEQAARKAFEDALALDPSESVARIRLAAIAYAVKDWDLALDLMDGVNPGLWPRGEVALLFERAECALHAGREDADVRLREVLRQDSKHVGALELMARLGRERGDEDTEEFALEALSLAIDQKRDPERAAKVLGDLAELRAKQGRYGDAASAAERALDLDVGSLASLERVADLYDRADRVVEASEAWRRVAGLRPPGQQAEAHERRAVLLERAARFEDAADVWVSLYESAGVERHRDEALRLAREHQLVLVLDRLGISATTASFDESAPTLNDELRAALARPDFDAALTLAARALREGEGDDDTARLALEAVQGASDAEAALALCEERLQAGLDADSVRTWAFEAGRIARDKLKDTSRAAGLMYRAHQAAPEDLDVRIELTALYGQIEELVDAAQTGVEQLLRRAPADPRVYHLASEVAAAQHNLERARAMRSAEHLLEGRASGKAAPPGSPLSGARGPSTVERVLATIGPSGAGKALVELVQLCAPELEQQLAPRGGSLAGARVLEDASPAAAALLQQIEALLPGRPLKVLVGPEPSTQVFPGTPLTVVFPEDALLHGDTVVVAHLARAVAMARLGGALFELLPKENEARLLGVVRALAEGNVAYPLANTLTASLDRETGALVADLAAAVMATGTPEVATWRSAVLRLADRFTLAVSGALSGALDAGALPGVYRAGADEVAAGLQQSARGLDLCRFAARPAAWVLRRELGMGG